MTARVAMLIAATILAAGLGLVVGRLTAPRRVDPNVSKLRDYCTAVGFALEMDVRDLGSSEEKKRSEAAERFAGTAPYHSEQEIVLCSSIPPDLRARDVCWVQRDYACLRKLAAAAQASVATAH